MEFPRHILSKSAIALSICSVITTQALAGKTLNYVDFVKEGDNDWSGLNFCYAGEFSQDGNNLYVCSTEDNRVTTWRRNPDTGEITQIQLVNANIEDDEPPLIQTDPSFVIVSADDKNVYVPAWNEDLLFVYARNPENGKLSEIQQITDTATDGMVTISQTSDSKYIIGSGYYSESTIVFQRDPVDGTVSVVDRDFRFGLIGPGLNAPVFVTVSPNDQYVYTADALGDSITIFTLDTETGQMEYQGIMQNNVNGVENMESPRWLTFSQDGRFLYVAGLYSESVVTFACNPESGNLTYLDSFVDEVGLEVARVVSLSPDETMLLANGYYGDTVYQFDRNPVTGLLTLKESYQNDYVPGALGFTETRAIVFSNDGENVYLVSWGDSGIATIKIADEGERWLIF